MEVRVLYSEDAMRAAAKYVAQHDPFFHGREEDVLHSIQLSIQDLVDHYPKMSYVHRSGVYVWMMDFEQEGVDRDDNIMQVEFMVDPMIGKAAPTYIAKTYRTS